MISADPDMHGATFIPIILGSDKTTVSVATGQQEHHPIYLSVGNVRNHAWRAHKDGLVLIGFLPIPKGIRSTIFCLQYLTHSQVLEGTPITKIFETSVGDFSMDASQSHTSPLNHS